MGAAGIIGWLEFWGKIAPAAMELGQDLYRRHRGDVQAATRDLKRITADFPKFEAARDETQQGFAELKEQAAEGEQLEAGKDRDVKPDNEIVDDAPAAGPVDEEDQQPQSAR